MTGQSFWNLNYEFYKSNFTLIVLCVALSLSALSNASTEHGHTETETKGPNGGILLSDGDLSVEITIYETGIPRNESLHLPKRRNRSTKGCGALGDFASAWRRQ